MKERQCVVCGDTFMPKSGKQVCCYKPIEKICAVCGKPFTTRCDKYTPTTCGDPECKKKVGYTSRLTIRKCSICGKEFKPTSTTQLYCNNPVQRICKVCGNAFTIKCTAEEYKKQTCSVECMNKLALTNRMHTYSLTTKICVLCGKEFHPTTNTQNVCSGEHYRKCIVCGKEFNLNYKAGEGQADLRKTCSDACYRKHLSNVSVLSDPEVRVKIKSTMRAKYGVEYPAQYKPFVDKMYSTYKSRTGYDHMSHNPNTLKGKNITNSSLESKVQTALINNQIEFVTQYQLNNEFAHHKFDFFLPKYNMLIDVDGEYYHGYLDDSNGLQISEDRDDARLLLVDNNYTFYVITERNFKSDLEDVLSNISSIDDQAFNYDEYMFNWCRSISFPYPQYDSKRLHRDYANLCKLPLSKTYNSHVKLGLSTIRHFHKSVYSARVGKYKSILEAWYDDELLRKVIKNRMIYRNNVDPSKILSGFYISKVIPKVSIFNPVLAKYLTEKYLPEFHTVTDPFSGFSGRLLGVCATGRHYTGYDLNSKAVSEASEIIKFHNLDATVSVKDIISDSTSISAECILTCPPYYDKETYSVETEYRKCEEWIDLVMSRYSCKKYVFVVDDAGKYSKYISETITTKSHYNSIKEYVVVISK